MTYALVKLISFWCIQKMDWRPLEKPLEKLFDLVYVRRPSRDYVARLVLDYDGATIVKQWSQYLACLVCYLPVFPMVTPENVKRGAFDQSAVKLR